MPVVEGVPGSGQEAADRGHRSRGQLGRGEGDAGRSPAAQGDGGRGPDRESPAQEKRFRGWGDRLIRYPASEKVEIIELVEQSPLSIRRTLAQLGIPRSTFYDWYSCYHDVGFEALDKNPGQDRSETRSRSRSAPRSSIWPLKSRTSRRGNRPPTSRIQRAGLSRKPAFIGFTRAKCIDFLGVESYAPGWGWVLDVVSPSRE